VAEERASAVGNYRASLANSMREYDPDSRTVEGYALSSYLTPELAPVQEREQVIYYDRKTGTHDVLLKPHWSAAYCPFDNELCDCSEQGQTKIGMYDTDGSYIPRTGYENIEPTVAP